MLLLVIFDASVLYLIPYRSVAIDYKCVACAFSCLVMRCCWPRTRDEKNYSTSLWGQTCDRLDRITECYDLPEMHVGNWMLFENMGAYAVAVAAASTFNGFQRPILHCVMLGPTRHLMQHIQNHDFSPEVEEQHVSTLPVFCAWKRGEVSPCYLCFSSINTDVPLL